MVLTVLWWYQTTNPDVAYIKIDPCLDEPVMYKKEIYYRSGDGDHKVKRRCPNVDKK